MVKVARRLGCGLAIAVLVIAGLLPVSVHADPACTVVITPGQVSAASSENFTVSVTNNGASSFRWVDITMPASNFTFTGSSVGGWFSTDHDLGATFNGGNITPGNSMDFSISGDIGADIGNGYLWTIQASTNMSGTSPIDCEGSITTDVGGAPPNQTPNNVSNVTVLNITTTGATVLWNSDQPTTSVVYYGLTDSYGSSSTYNNTLTTIHQSVLSGLSPDTTYHFQVAGVNSSNELAYSADGTFTTLPAPASNNTGGGTTSPTVTTTTKSQTSTVNPNAKNDKIPPTLTVDTVIKGAYKTPPVISGSASDNKVVAEIEYSIDGGKNWLPVTQPEGIGTAKAKFATDLPKLKDGNYEVMIRATDGESNTTTSASQILVIDQLPPTVGGSVLSVGPQIIYPDASGVVTALQDTDQRVTLSAVGGPVAVTLEAVSVDKQKAGSTFSMRSSPSSGLWDGVMNFSQTGDFTVAVHTIDGANNKTERNLFRVHVVPRSNVFRKSSDQKLKTKVQVYYQEPESGLWLAWDGAAYGQQNPQQTTTETGYGFYVPAGKYYVRYEAPGYATVASRTITFKQPSIITQDVYLSRRPGIYWGKVELSIPWVSLAQSSYKQSDTKKSTQNSRAYPTSVPSNTQLTQASGENFNYSKLLGKASIVTVMNTWSASSGDQLNILRQIKTSDLQVLPVVAGESVPRTTVYAQLAGYSGPILADTTNQFAQSMQLSMVPTHYFLDRHGVVKKVMVGVLSKQELLQNVQN